MTPRGLLALALSLGSLLGWGCLWRSQGELSVPAEAETLVRLAKADLAERLGVGVETIELAGLEAVEWPTTALGCPQPGMLYAQVITPGYRIELSHGGITYSYHSDRGSRIVYCEESS